MDTNTAAESAASPTGAEMLLQAAAHYERQGKVLLSAPQVAAELRRLAGAPPVDELPHQTVAEERDRSAAAPVTLATPCANPDCEHTLNWHTGTPRGVCVARGGACPCDAFVPPPDAPDHECVKVTALDGNDQPARDAYGDTWVHCGICGRKMP